MTTTDSILLLNEAGITKLTEPPTRQHNCWGFVAYILGWTDEARWLHDSKMEELLEKFSTVINEPKIGAIAVFRDHTGTHLQHTALVLSVDGEEMIHKPGGSALSNITKTEISNDHWTYYYNQLVEYRQSSYG